MDMSTLFVVPQSRDALSSCLQTVKFLSAV